MQVHKERRLPTDTASLIAPWPGMPGTTAFTVGIVSGALLSAAYEPLGFGWVVPFAFAPYLLVVRRSRWRGALAGSAGFGVGFMVPLLGWLQGSIGSAAWLSLSVIQASWVVIAALLMVPLGRIRGWPLWLASAWTSVELARSAWPFGGLPWGRVGFSVLDTPWAGLLPLVGPTATGWVLVWVAGLMAWALDAPRGSWTWLIGPVLPVAALAAVSLVPAPATASAPGSATAQVAVVQGGVPGEGNNVARHSREVTARHAKATRELAGSVASGASPAPDFIVWPENSTAIDPTRDRDVRLEIDAAASTIGVPILVGAITDAVDPAHLYNQGIVWSPADTAIGGPGPTRERYTKQHLVPFGEWIPFRSMLGGLSPRLEEVPRDMLPGGPRGPLDIAGFSVADAMCFDIAYDDVVVPQVRSGAELVVVQTSNASFSGTYQLDQQFAITRARALETGRSVVVASMNGISGVIGPDGAVVARAPRLETAVLEASVPLRIGLTPAVRYQLLWIWLPVALTAVGLVVVGVRTQGRSGSSLRVETSALARPVEGDRPGLQEGVGGAPRGSGPATR